MNALSTLVYTVRGNAHIHTIIYNIAIACTEPNNFMFTHASTDLNISTKSRYRQYPHTHRRTHTQCPMYAPVARKARRSKNALDVNPQIFSNSNDSESDSEWNTHTIQLLNAHPQMMAGPERTGSVPVMGNRTSSGEWGIHTHVRARAHTKVWRNRIDIVVFIGWGMERKIKHCCRLLL